MLCIWKHCNCILCLQYMQIVFAIYAYCVCNICKYADSVCNMHCIVFSLAVHCIINVALHCGKVQCIALLVTVTFIALHLWHSYRKLALCRGSAPVLHNLSVGYSSHLKSKHVGIFNKCIIKLLSFHMSAEYELIKVVNLRRGHVSSGNRSRAEYVSMAFHSVECTVHF